MYWHMDVEGRLVPIDAARRRWWLSRSPPFAGREPSGRWAAPLADFLDWLEARALWARFGL